MGPPLGNDNLLDFRSAQKTLLAAPTIHQQLFLKAPGFSIAIDIVAHRSSAEVDSLLQHALDRLEKPFLLIAAKRRHSSQRMDAGFKKSFIRIDVPDTRHKTLIQKKRLDGQRPPAKAVQERIQPVFLGKGLQAEAGKKNDPGPASTGASRYTFPNIRMSRYKREEPFSK